MQHLLLIAAFLTISFRVLAADEVLSCGDSAETRDFSAMDPSLFRVTIIEDGTKSEKLVGTATLVSIDEDPVKTQKSMIGHFITAAHVFEGDGTLPRPGKRFSGVIGLRPCSSRPNEPESGISGVTEIYHRGSLAEPDLSVLRARIDLRLVVDDIVEIAKLYVGTPKEIRNYKNLAYAGFPANAPDEIAPFGDRVSAIRYIPELKRPWALVGVTKSPDEGQSGSPLFDSPDYSRPIIYGVVVDVPSRDEVFMAELGENDKDWIERSFNENSVVLVQPIETNSPVLAQIPPTFWVREILAALRQGDFQTLASKLHKENVRQPAVDLAHLLNRLSGDKTLARAAANAHSRLGKFIASFSFDSYESFDKIVRPYLAVVHGQGEVRAFVSAEIGREILREVEACAIGSESCADPLEPRQVRWLRETAVRLIESDLNRVNAAEFSPGSRASKYLANLNLDAAKAQRSISDSSAPNRRDLRGEQELILSALLLDPKSAPAFSYAGDFFKETKRPATAAAAYLVAASNTANYGNRGIAADFLRSQCTSTVRDWDHYPIAATFVTTKMAKARAPELVALVECSPLNSESNQLSGLRAQVQTGLTLNARYLDFVGERAANSYFHPAPGSALRDERVERQPFFSQFQDLSAEPKDGDSKDSLPKKSADKAGQEHRQN